MHKIKRIREMLATSASLSFFATQKGFAELIERSPSLVRNVELGITIISTKLAKAISAKTGVDPDWLLSESDDGEIPSVSGGKWRPSMTLNRIKSETKTNFDLVSELAKDPDARAKLADLIGRKVSLALNEELESGSTALLAAVMDLLQLNDISKNETD